MKNLVPWTANYRESTSVNSEIFARIFFAKSVRRHICDIKNSLLEHDISKHWADFAISRGFLFSRNFADSKFRENKTIAKISEFTV